MPATNLYQYYTGMGQSLPSVSQNGAAYQKYGLGDASGFTGTAGQNTALLNKLQYGSPAAPTAPASGGYGQPSGGGYASTPSGQPQPITSDPGQTDLTTLAAKQAADLNTASKGYADTVSHAYQNASGSVESGGTGLTDSATSMNAIRNALNGVQNSQAAVIPQTIAASGGSMANNDQVTTQESTSNIPYAEQVARLSANLVPAENAYSAAQSATTARVNQVNNAVALQQAGFTQGQQLELKALQDKVSRGQALTDQEFSRETQLQGVHIQAQAQIQSATLSSEATKEAARTSAGATIQGANINADAALKAAAQQYAGIHVNKDDQGNYFGASPFGPQNPATSNGIAGASGKYFQGASGESKPPEFISSPNSNAGVVNGRDTSTGQRVDSSGFLLYPDGTKVGDDVGNGSKHGE